MSARSERLYELLKAWHPQCSFELTKALGTQTMRAFSEARKRHLPVDNLIDPFGNKAMCKHGDAYHAVYTIVGEEKKNPTKPSVVEDLRLIKQQYGYHTPSFTQERLL